MAQTDAGDKTVTNIDDELVELAHKRRKARRDVSAFKGLIEEPADGEFTMPGNGTILFRSAAGCEAGTTAGTVGSRTIKTPALDAGGVVKLDFVERGVAVAPAVGFAVLVDTGLGRTAKIAEVVA